MVKQIILAAAILTGPLHSIAQDSKPVPERTIRLDPDNQVSIPSGLVFEEVNYIPLETTRVSLFGAISQLLITDDFFIIQDQDTRCILLFYKNGKYHCKIKQSSNSKIKLTGDKSKIQFSEGQEIVTYDFDGKKSGSYLETNSTWHYDFKDQKTVYFQYNVNDNNPDTIQDELWLTQGNVKYAGYLPYNSKTAPVKNGDFFMGSSTLFYPTGTDSAVHYCRSYDYGIYRITTTGVTRPFQFIFPAKNSLPANFRTDSAFSNKRIEYVNQQKDLIWTVSHPYQIGNNLFFKTNRSNGPADAFLLNLKSENLVYLKSVQPDALTCYLPVTDLLYGVEFMNKNFLNTDGKYVYSSLSSALMFKLKDEMPKKNYQHNKVIREYFAKGNRNHNPVLVQIMPKNSF